MPHNYRLGPFVYGVLTKKTHKELKPYYFFTIMTKKIIVLVIYRGKIGVFFLNQPSKSIKYKIGPKIPQNFTPNWGNKLVNI